MARGADRVHYIDTGIRAHARSRTLRPDQDDRAVQFDHQVHEIGGLFQCGGAMGDDDAFERRVVGHQLMYLLVDLQPFGGADSYL